MNGFRPALLAGAAAVSLGTILALLLPGMSRTRAEVIEPEPVAVTA